MIIGYILAGAEGPFSWQEEHLLKEGVVDALFENPSVANLKFLDGLREELETNVASKIKSQGTAEESSEVFFGGTVILLHGVPKVTYEC